MSCEQAGVGTQSASLGSATGPGGCRYKYNHDELSGTRHDFPVADHDSTSIQSPPLRDMEPAKLCGKCRPMFNGRREDCFVESHHLNIASLTSAANEDCHIWGTLLYLTTEQSVPFDHRLTLPFRYRSFRSDWISQIHVYGSSVSK